MPSSDLFFSRPLSWELAVLDIGSLTCCSANILCQVCNSLVTCCSRSHARASFVRYISQQPQATILGNLIFHSAHRKEISNDVCHFLHLSLRKYPLPPAPTLSLVCTASLQLSLQQLHSTSKPLFLIFDFCYSH